MLDYHDAYTNNELLVTFEDCLFRVRIAILTPEQIRESFILTSSAHFFAGQDNRYFGFGAQTALVVANSEQNRMILRRTVFHDNNMLWNNTSVRSV
jgi:hypothetical protein